MPPRSCLALLTLLTAWLLACRQPSAELQLEDPEAAEPSGIDGPQVIVEAPSVPEPGPVLDWSAVDGSLAELIEGERYRIDYDADHPWSGASSPLVTIVVFYDYQCPYSKRLDESLRQLVGQYGDQLRVVWRQLPLPMHEQAELAARYALAAHAQGLFEPMHAWLFANPRALSREALDQQAISLGLDPRRITADVDGGWIAERVEADKQFAASMKISATPTMFINGRLLRGAVPVEKIEAVIEEELTTAERLIAAGSARHEVWARIMAAASPERTQPNRPLAGARVGPDPDKRYAMDLTGLTARGATRPKVEILMCGDFDCPYCKRSTATLDELLERHKNELAIYFRHQPLDFHEHAMPAHRAAVAADNQGEFWAMFELLYAEQRQRSAAEIEAMANQLGLDLAQFRKDIADPKTDELIAEQREFCEQKLDNRSTPGFFINGRPLSGARPIDAFEAVISEELAAAP